MNEKRRLIEDIKNKWIKRQEDQDFWQQFQGMANELSVGINSDDNHFIYELIQNAEDTKCNENKHILEFFLEKNGLLIFNNEIGFKEDEINAICAFTKSTKAKDKNKGYIGEKGIGFKSVFKITDYPAINSNGYRFYFRRINEEGNTEYVIPHWIDDKEIKNYPIKFQQNIHTTLYLPFSKDKKEENIIKLKDNIKDIEPIILLFLKELSNIKIFENNKEIINVTKTKSKSEKLDLVSITNGIQKDKYYLLKKEIIINKLLDETDKHNEKAKRKGVKNREIVVAFPDFKNKQKEDRLFSFLPTKLHTNLNFIIQADFILSTNRESISNNSEWNKFQIEKIEDFIVEEIIDKLKLHSKLKYIYLNYFIRDYESNNELIDNLYENILSKIKSMPIILTDKESWESSKNIVLLKENIRLDTKYIKLLFGENYEQVNKKFQLNNFFIEQFDIRKIDEKEIIEKICNYFDSLELNQLNKQILLDLTKFLAKYLSVDSRTSAYEKELFEKVKRSLPIVPKYDSIKKYYFYDKIYISSEYKPKFLIENIAKEDEFDFTQYNFLSDDYLEEKRLTDFIKNIIDEQERNKNKKTIEFFTEYSDILQNYLRNNINNYKKVFDFLIEIQEDNKDRISKIPLLLTQKSKFYDSTQTIYFSNDSDSDLNILDKNLLKLVQSESKYKEFLEKVFKVKEADILNIILNEYLPWIKNNDKNRNLENDKQLLKYTKNIIENFDKFEKEDKNKIKQSLFFISSNQKEKYLKSNNIYLTQKLAEIVFNDNSIEKYITDKSFFDFLDGSYNEIFEQINEEKTKEFIKYFSFEKNIKEDDIQKFIKFIKDNLDLKENIEALEFIAKSIDYEDRKKIKEIENFKIYSQRMNLIEIKNIFQDNIDDLEIDYLHNDYKKDINDLYFKNIKQYFQSKYKIEPFIDYLKQDIDLNEAVKIYKYLDSKSDFNPNKTKKPHYTITTEKIKKEFKNSKLIYSKDKKYYPTEVTWKEEKSANQLFALSTIYPSELQNFFIKKVQVSQTKDIRQIITQIKEIKEKNDNYFDLLIDLNDLVSDDSEIEKYYKSFDRNKPPVKNIYEDMKKFILEEEQIFILDNGKKNKDNNFYYNDLNIDIYDDELKKVIFSTKDSNYPNQYFDSLINRLNIKKISSCQIEKITSNYIKEININDYRNLLNFAYDLLFSKYQNEYKNLEDIEKKLEKINLIEQVIKYEKIETHVIINNVKLLFKNKDEEYIFDDKILKITNENQIFKIIANEIGSISDKELKDYYHEVIKGDTEEEDYYKNENIKKKTNFPLEISTSIVEIKESDKNYNDLKKDESNLYIPNNIEKSEEIDNIKLSAEEEREKRRKSGGEKVEEDSNTDETTKKQIEKHKAETNQYYEEIEPDIITDEVAYKNNFIKKIRKDIKYFNKNIQEKFVEKVVIVKKKATDTKSKELREKIKSFLMDSYKGYCQICGFTFRKVSDSKNYFEIFNWNDKRVVKKKKSFVSTADSLSLCRNCSANIKWGAFEPLFIEKINNIGDLQNKSIEEIKTILCEQKVQVKVEKFKKYYEWDDVYALEIKINGELKYIFMTNEHLIQFIAYLQMEEDYAKE